VENEIILDEHAKTSIKEHLTDLELNFERFFRALMKLNTSKSFGF
jgi:hypothetical protein